MDSDKNITANFTPQSYTLSAGINPPGAGSVTKSPDKPSYNCGEQVTVTATPSSCYIFTGWSGSAGGTQNPLTITMDGNKSLTANFAVKTFTLSAGVSGSGSVTKTPDQPTYNCGQSVTLTASPAASFNFTGWSGDASGTQNPLPITMDGNKVITATFAPRTYTLSTGVNPTGGGSVTKSPDKATYTQGEQVTLTANSASGYRFSSWSGSISSSQNPIPITMDSDKNITANFIAQYYLTVSTPYGTPTGQGWYDVGATAYAGLNTNIVDEGVTRRVFTHWSGAASGTNYAQSNYN